MLLHLFVHRDRDEHDAEHHDREQRDRGDKDQRGADVDHERGDHCAEHDERRPQQQPDRQVHAGLHLIDIAGHTRDKRRGTERIEVGVGHALDMLHERLPELCGKAGGGLRSEILRKKRAGQSDGCKQCHEQAHPDDMSGIIAADAVVDHGSDNERHEQFKCCFEHFEQRTQHAFFFVVCEKAQELLHFYAPSILIFRMNGTVLLYWKEDEMSISRRHRERIYPVIAQ